MQDGICRGAWLRLQLPLEERYRRGDHEPRVQSAIVAVLEPGDIVYDIGAYIGFFSLGAAAVVGDRGSVFAFEGDPDNVRRIHEHVAFNGRDGCVKVVHAAAWSRTAAALPFRRGAVRSHGGVEADGAGAVLGDGDLVYVPGVSIDDFVAGGSPAPKLLKIDVEGGEHHVLRGATRVFLQHRPYAIVEVHHREADCEIRKWLQECGYEAEWELPPEGFPRRLLARPAGAARWPTHDSRLATGAVCTHRG